tara:strand:- start:22922 stop:23524 length:603 start_codon:yes stop_codon:yes gene_type:complete
MKKTIFWLTISLSALGLAIYLFYIPPNQFFNSLSGGLGLYGFQTELTLSPYVMEDQQGSTRTWVDFADKPLYVTTGFTACRLTCPITMKFYQQMVSITGDKARYALLTIDSKNDTPQQIALYLRALDPNFIGLRVNNSVLFNKIISELQQVIYVTGEQDNIEHKSYIYLIHPNLSGLIIYTKPDINLMINDLKIIEMKEG